MDEFLEADSFSKPPPPHSTENKKDPNFQVLGSVGGCETTSRSHRKRDWRVDDTHRPTGRGFIYGRSRAWGLGFRV